jgi:hypothetical protein
MGSSSIPPTGGEITTGGKIQLGGNPQLGENLGGKTTSLGEIPYWKPTTSLGEIPYWKAPPLGATTTGLYTGLPYLGVANTPWGQPNLMASLCKDIFPLNL